MAFLRMLFHEKEFQQFGEDYPHLTGLDFIEQVFNFFDFSYAVRHNERERIPVTGRLVIIANHPIGTLDGMALLKLVSEVRSDVKVMANDVLMAIQPLHEMLLPVDNMRGSTARERLAAVYRHLESEGALIIFPAGEVSRMSTTGIRDGKWRTGFLRIAEATQSPILPVFVDARNSLFFYSLSMLSKPLSTLWLVREMFKHNRNSVTIRIGEKINNDQYQPLNVPIKTKVKLFHKQVYRIGKDKASLFRTEVSIAHPENRQQLKRDISTAELLGETRDHKKIYLYRYQPHSSLMREMGRLREESFRMVGEGTGLRRDIDRFDKDYLHIVLWDEMALEVVGAYRLRSTAEAIAIKDTGECKKPAFYSCTLFDFDQAISPLLANGLELGRSFVQPKYWGSRSLEYLWNGIGAFLSENEQYRYLLGPVSISNTYSRPAKDRLIHYYQRYFSKLPVSDDLEFSADTILASSRNPYIIEDEIRNELDTLYNGLSVKEGFVILKEQLSILGYTVPTLYKQYTDLCEEGGVTFLTFNIDHDFGDCVDGLVLVDTHKILETKRRRYGLDRPEKALQLVSGQ
jgi:putative hemolysin